jgi:uncharacterized protein YjiS (DUF1127 family)
MNKWSIRRSAQETLVTRNCTNGGPNDYITLDSIIRVHGSAIIRQVLATRIEDALAGLNPESAIRRIDRVPPIHKEVAEVVIVHVVRVDIRALPDELRVRQLVIARLRELEEHLLRDIGVDRADALREARKPFWRGTPRRQLP